MLTPILTTLIKHAQSTQREDILTALVASMMEFSPGFGKLLLGPDGMNCPEDSHRLLSLGYWVKTGLTYRGSERGDVKEDYRFRPDLVVSSSPKMEEVNHHRVVIESKVDAPLTINQFAGYSEIRKSRGSSVHLVLITDHTPSELEDYFNHVISWTAISRLALHWEKSEATLPEVCAFTELRRTFQDLLPVEKPAVNPPQVEHRTKVYSELEKITSLATFVKVHRRRLHHTQGEFAKKCGVGLRFIRDLEQGKMTLRSDKVNDVLNMFGCELGPIGKVIRSLGPQESSQKE